MAATLATIEAYLTAAQTAFDAGSYEEARKQIILGQIELMKFPASEGDGGSSMAMRDSFEKLLDHIQGYENTASRGTRRSQAEEV